MPVKFFPEDGFRHDLGDQFLVPPREWPLPVVHSARYLLNGEPEVFVHDCAVLAVMTPEEGEAVAVAGYIQEELPDGTILPTGEALQVDMTRTNVYAVNLVDTVWTNLGALCVGAYQRGEPRPSSAVRLIVGGEDGALHQWSFVAEEGDDFVRGKLRTAPIAPNGVGGVCMFTNVYLAMTSCTAGVVRLTPIIDGRRYEDSARDVFLMSLGDEKLIERFEIGLSVPLSLGGIDFAAQGIRGTWFQVEIDVYDILACGPVSIDGIELEYDPVTEDHPGRIYTEEPTLEYERDFTTRLLLGTTEGRILGYGEGGLDPESGVIGRQQSNPLAPAGAGGECIFTNLYIAVTRSNREPVTLIVTPILDGTDLPPLELVLEGVDSRVAEAHELGIPHPLLVGGEAWAAQSRRGTWFAVRIETDEPVEEGVFVMDGVELEYEPVTESEEPA